MSKFIIEITTTEVQEYSGTSGNGKPYHFRKQPAYLHRPDLKYPQAFSIMLPDDKPTGYPVGKYQLADDAIWVDRRGNLRVTPRLVPIAAKAEKVA